METKTSLEVLVTLHDETLFKLLEAKAMVKAQSKVDPDRIVKEVMDAKTMQIRGVTAREILAKNTEAASSLEGLLEAIKEMIEEEKGNQPQQKKTGVEK